MSNVIVIGAGLAGLSAACHLIGQGHQVVVVERESGPGGRARQRVQDGHTFELGPVVMTMPELLDEPLRAAGSSQPEAVPMRRLDPAYRGVFADGTQLRVRDSTEATAREIERLAGPADAQAFRDLDPFLADLYAAELPGFIDANFDSPLDLLRHPGDALRLLRMGAFGRLGAMIDRRITDDRVRRMLSFQALYAGLSPTDALGVYAVITYMDTFRGVYLPEGGMGAIPEGMASVVARHATLHYETSVTEVLRRPGDGAAAGVQTSQGPLMADAVVCTLDTPVAYRTLLPDVRTPRGLRRPVYSPSCVVLHLGVRGDLPDAVAHHNIHFGEAWQQCFDELGQGRLMSDPARLVTVSSLGEPSLAPAGRHTIYVLEPTPNLQGQVAWQNEREPMRERLLGFLQAHGYPTDVVAEHFVTPVEWQQQGMGGGTPFALAHLFRQTGPFRPSNREPRVPGLFFAGSSTTPGVGIPMVLLSGKLASQRVREYLTGTRGRP